MKTKTQHTPAFRLVTPIKSGTVTMHGYADIWSGNTLIAETVEIHLATFIVRAVNSHEMLLEAAKYAAKYLELNKKKGTTTHVINKAIAQAEKGINMNGLGL